MEIRSIQLTPLHYVIYDVASFQNNIQEYYAFISVKCLKYRRNIHTTNGEKSYLAV